MGSPRGGDDTSNLKGKLADLTETCRDLAVNLVSNKKEVQILRSEKETLENVLTMKIQDTRTGLINELHRVKEDIKNHYSIMKAESVRLGTDLVKVKTEKSAIEKEVVRMTRRIKEMEDALGKDSDEDCL